MANGFDLGSILQAAQLGRSLNPEVMQQQALGNQLAQQLQQLQIAKLIRDQEDWNNPQAANMRAFQAQLRGELGDPLKGTVALSPTDVEIIQEQGSIPSVGSITPTEQTALLAPPTVDETGFPVLTPLPRAARGEPITGIVGPGGIQSGFGQDINRIIQGAEREAGISEILNAPKQKAALELAKARYRAGTPKLYINPVTKETRYFNPGDEPADFQAYIRPGSAGGAGGLTQNAWQRTLTEYADLTGISPSKILDDVNSGILTPDKMSVTVGSLKGARGIDAKEITNYAALESMESDFNRVEKGIAEIEQEFGPILGRWNEFLSRYPVAEQDPRVAEVFAEINSLAADQIHEKYGGALTLGETKRANKWALDTALPVQTLKARIKTAKLGIASSKGAFEKTLKARNIRAPGLFESSPTPSNAEAGMIRMINPSGKEGLIPAANLDKALESGYKRAP